MYDRYLEDDGLLFPWDGGLGLVHGVGFCFRFSFWGSPSVIGVSTYFFVGSCPFFRYNSCMAWKIGNVCCLFPARLLYTEKLGCECWCTPGRMGALWCPSYPFVDVRQKS